MFAFRPSKFTPAHSCRALPQRSRVLYLRLGFSLVETLLTLVILALALAFAQPVWTHWQHRLQLQQALDQLQHSIHLARHTALAAQQTSHLCPSTDGRQCTGGRDFSQGWLVLQQGQVRLDHVPSNQLRIVANNGMKADNVGLQFLPSSLPMPSFAGMTVRFTHQDPAISPRCLVLARSARMRAQAC